MFHVEHSAGRGRWRTGDERSILGLSATVLLCAPAGAVAWKPADGPLMTRRAKDVSPDKVLPEYPRPQMVRQRWQNLNGLWDCGLTDTPATVQSSFDTGQILVPFAYEAALSGVGKPCIPGQTLWYRRSFTVPGGWSGSGQRVLLHFGAVNYESTIYLNGEGGKRGAFY